MNPATAAAPNVKQAVPFFGVTDIELSVRFYVDGLGFKKTKEWLPEGKLRWCWLELGDAALMLQEFWKEGHHTNVPDGKLGVGVSINFICQDVLAIYRDITARGIQATRPFVGNGMWVTSVYDPDGYRLYFESRTDAPEETEYSEGESPNEALRGEMKATLKNAWPYQTDKMNLPVESVEAAIPFYETVMGFKVVARQDAPQKSAVLERDGVQIGLAENGGDPTQDGCFFEVDNVENAFAELKSNGLPNESPNFRLDRHGATSWKVFFVVAPDGLCYCLGERQP